MLNENSREVIKLINTMFAKLQEAAAHEAAKVRESIDSDERRWRKRKDPLDE